MRETNARHQPLSIQDMALAMAIERVDVLSKAFGASVVPHSAHGTHSGGSGGGGGGSGRSAASQSSMLTTAAAYAQGGASFVTAHHLFDTFMRMWGPFMVWRWVASSLLVCVACMNLMLEVTVQSKMPARSSLITVQALVVVVVAVWGCHFLYDVLRSGSFYIYFKRARVAYKVAASVAVACNILFLVCNIFVLDANIHNRRFSSSVMIQYSYTTSLVSLIIVIWCMSLITPAMGVDHENDYFLSKERNDEDPYYPLLRGGSKSITFIWVCPTLEDWVLEELKLLGRETGGAGGKDSTVRRPIDIQLHVTRESLSESRIDELAHSGINVFCGPMRGTEPWEQKFTQLTKMVLERESGWRQRPAQATAESDGEEIPTEVGCFFCGNQRLSESIKVGSIESMLQHLVETPRGGKVVRFRYRKENF